MPTPRVSILIPNFNNGRSSSAGGQIDLIGDLLRSLEATLHADPTPLELIVCDDGSTDDSIDTLRTWAARTWPDGRPFLRLLEVAHTGRVSINGNRLVREARGDLLVRLDGDIVCLTPNWASLLVQAFDTSPPAVGVIGPKQLAPDGRIHAFGDFILHPNGYTHVAQGLPRHAVQHVMEVDHAMGCFYCCRRAVHEAVGGYDESFFRSETEDFGVAARLKGYRALALPGVEFIHRHGLRERRPSVYDEPACVDRDLQHFRDKWGFCRIAPDLADVAARYAGTGLLWNRRVFPDGRLPAPSPSPAPLRRVDDSDWARYGRDAATRKRIDFRVGAALTLVKQTRQPRNVVQLNAGVGLVAHGLARQGYNVLGLDADAGALQLARQCCAAQQYPGRPPTFGLRADPDSIPAPDGGVDLLLLFDTLERDANPVRLLKHAYRALAPGGHVLIVSPKPPPPALQPDPSDPATACQPLAEHRYLWHELLRQVQTVADWALLYSPTLPPDWADWLLAARKPGGG